MKAYSPIFIFICHVCKYTSVDIMPELKRNISNLEMEFSLNMRESYHTLLTGFMLSQNLFCQPAMISNFH